VNTEVFVLPTRIERERMLEEALVLEHRGQRKAAKIIRLLVRSVNVLEASCAALNSFPPPSPPSLSS
jgi:hypothetical protein